MLTEIKTIEGGQTEPHTIQKFTMKILLLYLLALLQRQHHRNFTKS